MKNASTYSLWRSQSSYNRKAPFLYLLAVLAVFLLTSPVTFAQNITGDLLGTVKDPAGAAVPNASVTATEVETQLQRTTTTSGQGEYTMSQMKPGVYRISVSAKGFKKADVNGVMLSPSDRKRTDVLLEVGETTESVTVTADTNSLQTDDSSVTSTVGERPLQELPLNGRNFIQLAQDQPGTNGGTPNSVTNGGRPDDRRLSTEVIANGQPEIRNNFLIDGLDDNDRLSGFMEIRPSLDAMSEVKVATNLYTAESGRTAGAVVSIFTKSGTDNFHGTAYEFFRNNITDAKSYFATTNPTLQQNQFGGSIGGPMRRGKTFFFGDYEGFYKNDATQNVVISTVPTLYEEQHPGDFTDAGGPVFTPTDSTGLGYFKLYPAPNRLPLSIDPSGFQSGNYVSDPSTVQHQSTFDVRIDQNFNSNNQLFGRYSFANTHTFTPPELPAVGGVNPVGDTFGGRFPGTANERSQNAQLNYLHIFTPKLLMELRGGYSQFTNNVIGLNSGKNLNDTPALSIPGANDAYRATELAYIYFGSYAPLGGPCCEPIYQSDNTFQGNGDVVYNLGAHSIKLGAGLVHRGTSYFQSTYGQGFIIEGLGGTPVRDMAELLGYPGIYGFNGYLYERSNEFSNIDYRFWESNAFIQDDWRLNKRLTLNLGLRYDVYAAPYNTNKTLANLDMSTFELIISPTGGVSTPYRDVAPRFGFAYSATNSTVIRGGAGLTYYPSTIQGTVNLLNPPYSSSTGLVYAIGMYLNQGIGTPTVPSTTNLSGQISTKPLNLPDSYAEQFNLSVQQRVGANILTVAYVGQLGRHEGVGGVNLDLPDPSGSSVVPAFRYAAQLPNVNNLQYYPSSASSSYHALQATFNRDFANGMSFNANYTWAHGLDDNFDSGTAFPNGFGLLPTKMSTYEYGNSDLDIKDRLAVLGSYVMPFAKNASGFKRLALKGWEANTVVTWQTGLPFTVADGVDHYDAYGNAYAQINLPGVTVDRPNVIGHAGGGGSLSQFFNIKAFAPQLIGTPGNERKNQYFGPHLRRADLSLVKNFGLPREANLQLRMESFNISNTPNFSNPGSLINQLGSDGLPTNSGLFGVISSVNSNIPPREFQFALKLSF
jgi:hypothetical protein